MVVITGTTWLEWLNEHSTSIVDMKIYGPINSGLHLEIMNKLLFNMQVLGH